MKCQTCSHLFNDNIHDDNYWNNLYDNAYTQDERKSNEQRNLMYQHDIHWISKVRPLAGNFLDIGCSFGNFFSFMPSNVKKIGIDISTKAQEIQTFQTLNPLPFHPTPLFHCKHFK